MIYLLDTNACIRLLNRSNENLAARFRATPPSRVRLCSIVKMELLSGARKSLKVSKSFGDFLLRSRVFPLMMLVQNRLERSEPNLSERGWSWARWTC